MVGVHRSDKWEEVGVVLIDADRGPADDLDGAVGGEGRLGEGAVIVVDAGEGADESLCDC